MLHVLQCYTIKKVGQALWIMSSSMVRLPPGVLGEKWTGSFSEIWILSLCLRHTVGDVEYILPMCRSGGLMLYSLRHCSLKRQLILGNVN